MDYSHVLSKYSFVPDKAAECGFEERQGVYTFRRPLAESGFYAVFTVSENRLEADVYEEPDGEIFLPFNSKAEGGFVSVIRAQVGEALDELLGACFELADVKAILLDYLYKKYGTVPESPWGEYEEYHTVNTAVRHKWYGLFMLIPYKCLGIDRDGKSHVLNLKARPEEIPPLLDNIHYFPAYHMNKKHWLSILLDRDSDIAKIKALLDDSYALAEGKK